MILKKQMAMQIFVKHKIRFNWDASIPRLSAMQVYIVIKSKNSLTNKNVYKNIFYILYRSRKL